MALPSCLDRSARIIRLTDVHYDRSTDVDDHSRENDGYQWYTRNYHEGMPMPISREARNGELWILLNDIYDGNGVLSVTDRAELTARVSRLRGLGDWPKWLMCIDGWLLCINDRQLPIGDVMLRYLVIASQEA